MINRTSVFAPIKNVISKCGTNGRFGRNGNFLPDHLDHTIKRPPIHLQPTARQLANPNQLLIDPTADRLRTHLAQPSGFRLADPILFVAHASLLLLTALGLMSGHTAAELPRAHSRSNVHASRPPSDHTTHRFPLNQKNRNRTNDSAGGGWHRQHRSSVEPTGSHRSSLPHSRQVPARWSHSTAGADSTGFGMEIFSWAGLLSAEIFFSRLIVCSNVPMFQ